jgi:hypothetical protein
MSEQRKAKDARTNAHEHTINAKQATLAFGIGGFRKERKRGGT